MKFELKILLQVLYRSLWRLHFFSADTTSIGDLWAQIIAVTLVDNTLTCDHLKNISQLKSIANILFFKLKTYVFYLINLFVCMSV